MQPTLNVVITGASAGLGRAIAHEFGKAGARVGLISRDLSALELAAAEVERLGGTAATYAADVSDDQAIEAAAASFEERLGPIDVWVNNAMVSVFSPIKEMEAAEFRRVTEVNYLGYVHGTLAALAENASAKSGPDHSGRLSSSGAKHSSTGSLLREQTRYRRFYGFATLRTYS
jgi:NAD(P)-dependent dehydrogenase (short-subunit alcohol dehydrogenase family)